MEVRTIVEVSDKEIRDLVHNKAREAAGKDAGGGSSTVFKTKPKKNGSDEVELSAEVTFTKGNAR